MPSRLAVYFVFSFFGGANEVISHRKSHSLSLSPRFPSLAIVCQCWINGRSFGFKLILHFVFLPDWEAGRQAAGECSAAYARSSGCVWRPLEAFRPTVMNGRRCQNDAANLFVRFSSVTKLFCGFKLSYKRPLC